MTFPSGGGVHCESTALGVLLHHRGLDLSESMIFGLGSGLSFVYWDSKRQDVPFLGGRVKPFELTRALAQRLGLDLQVRETTSGRLAWTQVAEVLDSGAPVGLQLDSFYLDYFTQPVHFAGHVAALVGYDEDDAWLVDTEQQGGQVRTSRESLARARAARGPMSARHRSFTIGPASDTLDVAGALVPAIRECARAFLDPPIANLGVRGIRTTATRVPGWLDRVAKPKDLATISLLMERAGTGGGLFRRLYCDFLTEAAAVADGTLGAEAVRILIQGRDGYATAAELWTQAAHLIEQSAGGDPDGLRAAARVLERVADVEFAAMSALAALPDR